MHFNTALALQLSLASLAFAIPQRPSQMPSSKGGPGLIDDLLQGNLNDMQKQIKDYLGKAQSSQDFSRMPKPPTCSIPGFDKCCVCEYS